MILPLFALQLLASAAPAAGALFFNEVRANDAGPDDAEFVELLGFAGLDLEGWTISHHNGSDSGDGPVFQLMLAGALAPVAGLVDASGSALGLAVYGAVPGARAPLPGGLQNGPDGLVLRDPSGGIADAIAWGGAGDLADDDPGLPLLRLLGPPTSR